MGLGLWFELKCHKIMKSIFYCQSTLNSKIKVPLVSPIYTFFPGTMSLYIKAGITKWLKPNVKISIESVFQENFREDFESFQTWNSKSVPSLIFCPPYYSIQSWVEK